MQLEAKPRRVESFLRFSPLRLGALVILAICLGGHVTELFDHWESARISGNDIDYALVVVAAAAGATIVLSQALAKLLPAGLGAARVLVPIPESAGLTAPRVVSSTHSPPLSLRI